MTTPVIEVVDSLKIRLQGAPTTQFPQLSASPANQLWLTDSADPLNTSANAALQVSLAPTNVFLEGIATDGVTPRQLQLGNMGGVALVPSGGNVGIGTATAAADKLVVQTPTNQYGLTHTDGTTVVGSRVGTGVAGTPRGWLGTKTNHPLSLFTNNGGPQMTLDISGNVGIGTTSPSAKLNIDPQGAGGLVIGNSNTSSGGFTSLLLDISAAQNGFARVQAIQASGSAWGNLALNPEGGNVGVGNTAPAAKLDVSGDLKVSGAFRFLNSSGGEASLTGQKFDNESALQQNNVKVIMGATGLIPINRPLLVWEFAVGDTFFGISGGGPPFHFGTFFNKKFSVNQNGTAYFAGGKTGYVVDQFVNKVGDKLEQGDVVVLGVNATSLFSGTNNNIPLPEVDLTDRAYDTRVCGIVAEVVTEQELPFVEMPAAEIDADTMAQAQRALEAQGGAGSSTPVQHPFQHMASATSAAGDRTVVANEQLGQMVTLGAFAHCKVDADIAAIEVGDLLTTSPTHGHAQKVLDPTKAVGAIIGKALAALPSGKGKIPVLVMLQ